MRTPTVHISISDDGKLVLKVVTGRVQFNLRGANLPLMYEGDSVEIALHSAKIHIDSLDAEVGQ